ncbi:MAG TPA: BamA/TamA family outer membrane protein [Acidocella sp.]|nr:BamA/TamA family outer membrane protein [Acidocella sp.]
MRRYKMLLLAVTVLMLGPTAQAADPVAYSVNFTASGDKELDGLLKETSSLVSLQKKLPPAPFALIGRARADVKQFTVVLHSLGYDAGSVGIAVDGEALDNPALLDKLTQAPADKPVTVQVVPHQGKLFLLGHVGIAGLPAGFKPPTIVKPGQVARAAPILAGTTTLRIALRNAGYAFATVSEPLAVAQLSTDRLDVTYTVTPGPRVNIGPVAFSGLTRTNADFLRKHIALRPGQAYSETALATARDSLLSLGVFTSVTPVPEEHITNGNEVPILFRVIQQKRHAVTIGGAYATDLGFTLTTSWKDRDLFGHAETLTFSAAANGLAGTGTTAPGYDLKGLFTKPDFLARTQVLSVSLEGLKESITAYDRTAVLAGASLSRPILPHVTIAYGLAFVTEKVLQEGVSRNYVLLQMPLALIYDTTNSLLEPIHGIRASVSLTPTAPVRGDNNPFLIAQGSAATYIPVEHNARGIIALRAQVASIQGATQFQVPPDQRLYAGGSGTVRGYTYQTIGPLFPDDKPEGGLAMDAFSVEFRQHVGKNFGIVPFIDAGQVSAGSVPFTGTLRVGAGLGVRYYTSIGPIRLDIAFPLTRVAGSGSFALYIGLGEAF